MAFALKEAAILFRRAGPLARDAVKAYEALPAPVRLGLAVVVIPAIFREAGKLGGRIFAEGRIDKKEIDAESTAVVHEFNQLPQDDKRGLAQGLATEIEGNYSTDGKRSKMDSPSKVFADTKARLHDEAFLASVGFTPELVDRLATATLLTRMSSDLTTLSELLAVIPNAQERLQQTDEIVHNTLNAGKKLGQQLAESAVEKPMATMFAISNAVTSAKGGWESGKQEHLLKVVARETKTELIDKFQRDGDVVMSTHPDDKADWVKLLDTLTSQKVIKRTSRRSDSYNPAEVKAVIDALIATALEASFAQPVESATNAEKAAQVLAFIPQQIEVLTAKNANGNGKAASKEPGAEEAAAEVFATVN